MEENIIDFIKIGVTISLGVAGWIASIRFSNAAKSRDEDKMLKEIFTDSNLRYDKLNNGLQAFVDSEGTESVADVLDYFNLCAEEYYWYKKRRIDEKIWKSWNAGMQYWYGHKVIKGLWKKEIANKNGKLSYYIENGDEFFKD